MATSSEAMQQGDQLYKEPVYVWQLPVRLWHWIHAISITVLGVSGYLIANPLPSLSGEASDHFLMGNIRLIHFISAYVFGIAYLVRFYWAFVGNRWSRQLFVLPVWRASWWAGVFEECKSYLFFTRKQTKNVGHNPLAQIFIWLCNFILVVVMICTGGALYSQGSGLGSWADVAFGWVFSLVPSSQAVRMYHLMGMWLMVVFVIVHLYLAIRQEIVARHNVLGSIISGWRTWRDDGPRGPQ